MKQKRRYKRYLEDKYEQRSRSQKYRNPPSSISNYGSSTPNATVPDQNDSCGSKLNDSDNATCDDCNESEACISQQNDLPIVLPNQDQSLLGEESVWCSASDMSSTHSANSDRGEVRLGGAQDELFNGHWDRDAHEQIMTASECENGDNDSHAEGDELNVAGNDRLGGFPRLRSFIAKNENNEIKHACMDVNNCEIVLAVLKYALTYSLSQTAVADLFKLICVLLGCDDLPSSRYLLDKLFNNTEGVVYHACCPEFTCGIWFGKDKPEMQIFLKEFVLCMNKLSDEGVPCQIGETIEHIRVFCPCGCVDSMARGPMQGMKLCTGYFGCNWCLHPGLYVTPGPGKKGAVKYVCLDGIADRTEAETKEHMREAAASTEDVCGLKCASWLINLFCFNIIWGFVPDSMHHVDLGLGKQFLERWLTVLTPSERGKIDSFMKKIKVPNNIQRLSRPIKDRKFWKAQEWENFILYYSLPILRSFPHMSQIADHWSLLVEGVPSRRNRDRMNLSQNARIYRKMVKAGCLYRSMHAKSVRSDDSYAQLYDGSFIHIVEFLVDENLDRSTTVCKPLQVRPVMGRNLPTVIIVCENNEDAYINTSNIRTVCVAVRIDDVVYLTPPPNLYRN
ncbi:hypothetical protein QAD02_013676 [Eretmocerus hayati]|uniref:Uncharacterized protein n=1 Tax=Eretmocerus hayati TaxID=131215 RepID=A0ACC2P2U2_9HYME|nr:hypothetical protein QAD02_013676 [Eretmocerus hayati]